MTETPWLLLLYSFPAGRRTARVGLRRKLRKSGALPFKASRYLLPNRPELFERFQLLVQQVQDADEEILTRGCGCLDALHAFLKSK